MTQVTEVMKPTITGLTLQEWVNTLPQGEQDEFAAAEARRVALVNEAVAAGKLTVDADDNEASAELTAAINAVLARNSDIPDGTGQLKVLLDADPRVLAAKAAVESAKNTPTYTWASEEARINTVITDPVWLAFWDRWAATNVVAP